MSNIKIIICCNAYLAKGGEIGLRFAGKGLEVQNDTDCFKT
jgi:hypothetical protein